MDPLRAERRLQMNVPLTCLLMTLFLSVAPAHTKFVSTAVQRGNQVASGAGRRTASVPLRSLQSNKQDKDSEEDSAPNEMPVATPLTLAPAPSPILFAPFPTTLAPVIQFGSTWETAPAESPVTNAPNNGKDGSTTESWAFKLASDPPVNGNLLIVMLEDYLNDAVIVFANGEFVVESPQEKVMEHQDAVRNIAGLQSHMQQTLGDAFLVETTQIVLEDVKDSSIEAGVSPTTTTDKRFSKKDIVLLVCFGVSMTVIVSGIASLFLWKKRETGADQKGQSKEWTYDKDKEDRLAAVETLSSTANQEEN